MTNAWDKIDFSNIDSPALIIDQEKVRLNIQLAIEYAGGTERLRPHVKTHKMLKVAAMQVEEGISKFKCATIAEAEMLGMTGAKDVLIAYPVLGPKINRALALGRKFPATQFSILVDNILTLKTVDEKCKTAGQSLGIYIDVNNGSNRTGINIYEIDNWLEKIKSLSHANLIGVHCYDGHLHMSSLEERTQKCKADFEAVELIWNQLQKALQKKLNLVAGGTPTFPIHAKHSQVECSPGTFVFWDEGYATLFGEQKFQKAAVLMTRVISKISPHIYCLDLGYKSVGSEFPLPRVAFLSPHQFTQTGHSEEHLVIKSHTPDVLEVGQILLAHPYHICPTVALYEQVHVASMGRIIGQWEVIARKRKITL